MKSQHPFVVNQPILQGLYETTFCKALSFLEVEGIESDDPDDRGSLTRFGISQKSYPKLDIKNLTYEKAAEIYYSDYWCRNKCDQLVNQGFIELALMLFDASVNHGSYGAARFLQEILGVFPDGVIGNNTLTAINKFSGQRQYELICRYVIKRACLYSSLSHKYPSQQKFFKGWINRLNHICEFIFDVSGGSHG